MKQIDLCLRSKTPARPAAHFGAMGSAFPPGQAGQRVPYSVAMDACSRGLPSHIHFLFRLRSLEGRAYNGVTGRQTAFSSRFPSGSVEHLPELSIGKIRKLLSKYWSLSGKEQQLSVRRQIAYLIRSE